METILVERLDGIVTVTLSRPERKNALNRQLLQELVAVCHEISARPHEDRAVVVTGRGDVFCSGGDLAGPSSGAHALHSMRLTSAACLAVHDLPQPTVAKVRGAAVGAGLSLALACDLVVASSSARFSTMYTQRALSPDFGASWLLPRHVGVHTAKELVYFPDFLSAKKAREVGLINRVVPDNELDAFVEQWARRLAAAPTIALSLSKRLLDQATTTDLTTALEGEASAQVVNFGTEDAREARAAFVEHRPPRFSGR